VGPASFDEESHLVDFKGGLGALEWSLLFEAREPIEWYRDLPILSGSTTFETGTLPTAACGSVGTV
jgi:hypothetical protein